ncbi:MAG: hypothetical protein ACXQTI_03505 [Candidatus Nezhaarchaeales archaeon]
MARFEDFVKNWIATNVMFASVLALERVLRLEVLEFIVLGLWVFYNIAVLIITYKLHH